MKKYAIKATALAIGALVGGAAFAAVDFTASPVAVTGKYASEISYAKTTGQSIAKGTDPTSPAAGVGVAAIGNTTIKTKLGFGVSAGQQRYIRIDLGGLKLGGAAAATDLNDITQSFGAAGANRTVVSGGSVDDTYIIYQITGNASGHGAADEISWAAPALRTTAGNGATPTVTYQLFETAVAAANNVAGTSLYNVSSNFFTFASGLSTVATTYTNTATVATSFKQYLANGAAPTTTNAGAASKAQIGNLAIAAAAGVVRGDGTGVVLADLLDPVNKVVFKGDFTGKGAGAGATVGTGAACAAIGANNGVVAADKLSITFTTVAAADLADLSLCFATDGTVAQPAQTLTYDFNPVAAATNVTVTDPSAATIGTVVRDGTILQAPFATVHPDYLSRVVLTSQASTDVAFTAIGITEDGVTCSKTDYAGTLKAGKQLFINTKDICGTLSAGTRLAIQVVAATPLGTIHGAYNVMNYNQTTGATDSLITYPMVRPTEN